MQLRQSIMIATNVPVVFGADSKLKSHVNVCKNQSYYDMKMSDSWNKILKFTQNHKSNKIPFVTYAETKFAWKNILI